MASLLYSQKCQILETHQKNKTQTGGLKSNIMIIISITYFHYDMKYDCNV